MRPIWVIAFLAAILFDIAGTVFALNDVYVRKPVFAQFGLTSHIDDDGSVLVQSMLYDKRGNFAIAEDSRIVAINGNPVPDRADIYTTVAAIRAVKGPSADFRVKSPDGAIATHRIERSDDYVATANRTRILSLDQRLIIRFVVSFACCLALLACAALLFLRRPRDPVCLLLSFSFVLFAAIVDPPAVMWLALGWGEGFDFWSGLAWMFLVLGIAVFPDGHFVPHATRWLLVIAPVGAVLLMFDDLPDGVGATIAFMLPLALLSSHLIKYRRFEAGIERQQIKWAAFGFASGLISLTLTFAMLIADPNEATPWFPVYQVAVLFFFSLGFMLMALFLLVALIRYRLWEADTVISRSAAYAVVTVIVGIVWAASTDGVKALVEAIIGEENKAAATATGAVLAAGLFAPTQSFVLRWTKRRFDKQREGVRKLIERLASWRTNLAADEIGTRALASIEATIHVGSAAILANAPHGRSLIAARDIADPEILAQPGYDLATDPRFVLALPLEDDDGPLGTLVVGPRSDGNRYNRDERKGLDDLIEPLADALRHALGRAARKADIEQLIGSVDERLKRLEGGDGKPAET